MAVYAGDLLTAKGFVRGWVEVAGGRVAQVKEGEPPEKPAATGVLVPSFWNAHTHVGDSFLFGRDMPRGLVELVGPGGWKQHMLETTPRDVVLAGMKQRVAEMAKQGTGLFLDFREGGSEGIALLREAAAGQPVHALALGRTARSEAREVEDVVTKADGVGISSIVDVPFDLAQRMAQAAKRAGKLLAIHVSEGAREDLGKVLDLRPDMVVHMVKGTREDFEALAAAKVPVAVCPRANAYFRLRPPVPGMLEAGVEVLVGTDNGMLADGNLLAELGLLRELYPSLSDETLLRAITHGPSAAIRLPRGVSPPPEGFVLLAATARRVELQGVPRPLS